MSTFNDTIQSLGADLADLKFLDNDGPHLLPYATLVSVRNAGQTDLQALTAVYEWQSSPLIFLINGDDAGLEQRTVNHIRRCVALRGDAPYVGVISNGRLLAYNVSLDSKPLEQVRVDLNIPKERMNTTFPYLANLRPGAEANKRNWISKVILKLLSTAIDSVKGHSNVLSDDDAISLVGRALFARFLADRQLLPNSILLNPDESFGSLFSSPPQAVLACNWLDSTFNGDFLPLSPNIWDNCPARVYTELGNIMRRAAGGQLHLGWEEKWANLDFSHIPVGVLSEAYEHYLRNHDPLKQRREGGYYTPRMISNLMVRGSFHALRQTEGLTAPKVLDPAAGAGVFLLASYRELVAERWHKDARRPDTEALREILYNQIVGFDINEAALRFSALGLYLMAIELDAEPEPVQKLRFQNLRGKVLHKFTATDIDSEQSHSKLGSLGPLVGDEHLNEYDLVIGNPPWSSATHLSEWQLVEEKVKSIAEGRLGETIEVSLLPNEVMDLPFIWRAMEWAKPGAQITFVVHARVLFQHGDGMPEARNALVRALNITSIVNGAELRQTNVWPQVSAPFCMVFAKNHAPLQNQGFRYITPRLEQGLNNAGAMRIDAGNANFLHAKDVISNPTILKTLFRGSELDVEILRKISELPLTTLDQYWSNLFGRERNRPRCAGNGYQKLRESSEINSSDSLPGVSGDYLASFRELRGSTLSGITLDIDVDQTFGKGRRLHRKRSISIFKGPLLIVRQSPSADINRIEVCASDHDLVYNESFYGYSAREHRSGALLVRYLSLVIGSKVALWHSLMTSGKFGFERDVVEKLIVDKIPFRPFEDLSQPDLDTVSELFRAIGSHRESSAWDEVDSWVASLFGLSKRELQVIDDTLAMNLPFSKNKSASQRPPDNHQVDLFCQAVQKELAPWTRRFKSDVEISPFGSPATCPWRGVMLQKHDPTAKPTSNAPYGWEGLLRVADEQAASEVVLHDSPNRILWIGKLDQTRYWTQSQARLTARRVLWEHAEFLTGGS